MSTRGASGAADGPTSHRPPDLLQRDFRAAKPNQRWVADIAEFPTDEGTLYLAGVRDLCDRSLVGWAAGAHQDAELVVDALTMAL